jgi:flagellar assembly protein FliH
MLPSARSTLVFSEVPRSIHLVGNRPVVTYTEEQFDEAVHEAFKRGGEEVRRELEPKLLEAKADVKTATQGAFSQLLDRHDESLSQMRVLLPRLIAEATARVVGALPIDAAFVRSVANDLLADVAPGADTVEVQFSPADLAKVDGFDKELRHRFQNLRLVENDELKPGDCLVKTRFGVMDGRMSSKLKSVEGLLS